MPGSENIYDKLDEYPAPPEKKQDELAEVGMIKELDPKKVKDEIKMNLKGYEYDTQNEKWIKEREPLMNEDGINKYMTILSSVINSLLTFSNYKPDEINTYVDYVCSNTIPVIYINYKEYGIKHKSDLNLIETQLFNLTMAAFKKAMGAGDRNLIRGTVTESMATRMGYSSPQSQQKSGWEKLNPFAKK